MNCSSENKFSFMLISVCVDGRDAASRGSYNVDFCLSYKHSVEKPNFRKDHWIIE